MNPHAASELLEVIMLDDFVDRRKAIDRWSRRWLTTMHVDFVHDGKATLEELPGLYADARGLLIRQILQGLLKDDVNVLLWGKLIGKEHSLACEMHCIMQKPREVT